jgi:hypothetical protein
MQFVDTEFKVTAFDIATLTEQHKICVEVNVSGMSNYYANKYLMQVRDHLTDFFAPAKVLVYPAKTMTIEVSHV